MYLAFPGFGAMSLVPKGYEIKREVFCGQGDKKKCAAGVAGGPVAQGATNIQLI